MNKQTKITLCIVFGVLILVIILLIIGIHHKEALQREYDKYRFVISNQTNTEPELSEYELVIEFCLDNGLDTDIVMYDKDLVEAVPAFIDSLNVQTYYICDYEYESVYVAVIDGKIVSNLEEVKRYFE